MSYSVTFKGFPSVGAAQKFADWFEGAGEQDAAYWCEEEGEGSPYTKKVEPPDEDGNISVEIEML